MGAALGGSCGGRTKEVCDQSSSYYSVLRMNPHLRGLYSKCEPVAKASSMWTPHNSSGSVCNAFQVIGPKYDQLQGAQAA